MDSVKLIFLRGQSSMNPKLTDRITFIARFLLINRYWKKTSHLPSLIMLHTKSFVKVFDIVYTQDVKIQDFQYDGGTIYYDIFELVLQDQRNNFHHISMKCKPL